MQEKFDLVPTYNGMGKSYTGHVKPIHLSENISKEEGDSRRPRESVH